MDERRGDAAEDDDKSKSRKPLGHRLGWFPEGSVLDHLDKDVSRFIFRLELGAAAEWILLAPGCYFGLPATAWCIVPLLVTWYAEHRVADVAIGVASESAWLAARGEGVRHLLGALGITSQASAEYLGFVCAPIALSYSVYFYWCVGNDTIEKAYRQVRHFMVPSLALFTFIGMNVAPDGYRAGCFFIVAWTMCQALSHFIKVTAARSRPLLTMSGELKDIKRHIPEVQSMLKVGQSAFESFPSGDTVGAATFSATLYALGCPLLQSVGFGALTGFCRMYFHAHHLLDVTAGFAVGFVPTLLLAQNVGIYTFGPLSVAASLISFIGFHMASNRIKPRLPDEYIVSGRVGF